VPSANTWPWHRPDFRLDAVYGIDLDEGVSLDAEFSETGLSINF